MTRTLVAAVFLALVASPIAYAQDEALASAGAEYLEEDDYFEEDVEFCGGGEETLVDEAYYAMEGGDAEGARDLLIDALRRGDVADWERPSAIVTLAEAQLRLGETRSAVVNYRKALRRWPDQVGPGARVGLASALFLRGSRGAAFTAASAAADQVCSDRWSQVACYGAQQIIARTSRDDDQRAAAATRAAGLRGEYADLTESFDRLDYTLGLRRTPPVG
ncbi:MAG: hypothetical protein VYE22_12970 [Myxococcota bacterium]|nr:hypothetical protein [Myxococcota bacterium]